MSVGEWSPVPQTSQAKVIECRIQRGYTLLVRSADDEWTRIRVDGASTLTLGDGTVFDLPADAIGWALAPASHLVDKDIKETLFSKGGRLKVVFSDGSLLEAEPDETYESWSILVEPRGPYVVSVPDGAVAIWDDLE